jgi:serine/threonine protein kinase/tetratricopeptide (TPR) repeat protein
MAKIQHLEHESQPIGPGMLIGDFLIGKMIGCGGMGRVFAAVDQRNGEAIAIKTLLSNGAVDLEFFRREIETLSVIRHPGLVPLRAHGVFREHPWYAMDLLEGSTLRDALAQLHQPSAERGPESWIPTSGVRRADAGSGPAAPSPLPASFSPELVPVSSPQDLIRVCTEVLQVLAYIHDKGVVHGDVKPENIFLNRELRPVLVDLGLTSAFDLPRERLALLPRSAGSVAYMAPERLRGALPDARADLYAVGCILYECLTGQHPFMRSTVEATTLAHLRAQVVPPSRLRPDIPRQLDALVLRLLARDAADRPGYALDAIEVLSGTASGSGIGSPDDGSRSSYLHRAPLVCREAELDRLRELLDEAAAARGNAVLIRGKAGIGKTRLVLELLDVAMARGAVVLHLECRAPDLRLNQPWLQPLEALVRSLSERVSLNTRDGLLELGAALHAVSERNGQGPAQETRLQTLVSAVLAACAEHTVVVVFDDLHRADELTLSFVQQLLAKDIRDSSLLLVCTAQEAAVARDLPLGSTEQLELGPLGESEIETLVNAMLALEFPSPTLIQRAQRISEGNPAILGHYLRALIGAGVLRRNRHQGWYLASPLDYQPARVHEDEAPVASIRALFEWRIDALTLAELRLASIAALLNVSFDAEMLSVLATESKSSVEAALEALCRHEILERRPDGYYRFSHELLREILEARLPVQRPQRLHRRAAALLWRRRAEAGVAASVLAHHLSRCGAHHKAAASYSNAARGALHTHRRQDALDFLEASARELLLLRRAEFAYAAELLELYELQGDTAVGLRQYAKAQRAFSEALRYVGNDAVARARQHRKLAGAHQRDHDQALHHLQQALTALATVDLQPKAHRNEWIQVNLDTMWVYYWRQRTSELLEIAQRIGPDVSSFGSDEQRASLNFNLSVGLMQHHRYVTGDTEVWHIEQALNLYEKLEQHANVAMCRFVRSMLLLCAGKLELAEQGFETVLAISSKATSVTIRIRALTYLCILQRKRRDTERVRKLASAAYAMAIEHDMREYQGTAMANLAWVAFSDGALAECERLARAAVSAWDASPLNVFRWTGLLPLMGALLSRPEQASDSEELAALAQSMLDVTQQQLPTELEEALERVHAARFATSSETRTLARRALEIAVASGLM